ncbi:GNAT family N-acetyltransferase [Litorimonas sp. RW-G-Af-16]|uniref:GNAT family N-acetyltransferase n=1 Tax=Litorimonas sp. RW-G-Af-16 TaxID=3241168 RepID=UPI00390CD1E1
MHWLSPLDDDGLDILLGHCSYQKQIDNASGVLLGYGHDVDYDHKNLQWLRPRFDRFYYIDRIIIDIAAHGKGLASQLYADFEQEARARDLPRLVCEVNTKPNNSRSHAFHLRQGFEAIGDVDYPDAGATLRYYEKRL